MAADASWIIAGTPDGIVGKMRWQTVEIISGIESRTRDSFCELEAWRGRNSIC